MKRQIRICLTLALAGWSQGGWAADVPTRGAVINIVTWDGRNLAAHLRTLRTSFPSPWKTSSISAERLDDEAISRMVRERRFAGTLRPTR